MSDGTRWPRRSWIPVGGWDPAFPEPPPRPKFPPNLIIHPGHAPPPPPNRIVRTPGRVPPLPTEMTPAGPTIRPRSGAPPPPYAPPDPGRPQEGPSPIWDAALVAVLVVAVAALIWSGITYAGKGEPTCVALSSVGPGVGTHGEKILWSGWACEGDDGLWRWSHPARWDLVTVSETPPVEVAP